jgi:hypothetical protein
MAIVGARMAAAQTLEITVMAEVQQLKMHVVKHHYNFDLTFLNGIVAMSVDTDRNIESTGPGKSWIIGNYDEAQKQMNLCAVNVLQPQEFVVPMATVRAEEYLLPTVVQKMTVLVAESKHRLDLAFYPEVLSGGPNHVNIMLCFSVNVYCVY